MNAQPIVLACIFSYFLVVLFIGVWAARRTRDARDFFIAGQSIGLLVLGISAMAATLSGFAFIGGPGLVYSVGMGAIFIILPAGLTNTMTAWVLARRMRMLAEVRGIMTIPAAIEARYRSPAARGLAALAILVATIGYMATNILALGLVIKAVTGMGLTSGIWIGALVTLAYSATGGILAGVYTDVFQGTLMALASVCVFVLALHAGGGLSEISRTIMATSPEFLSGWGKMSPLIALSLFLVFALGALGQPHVLHKFYMLKDPARLRWYPLVMTIALTLTLLLFFGVGFAAKALVLRGRLSLASPDDATPQFLLHFTPPLLAGLVFAGVVAAIMSTVNSFMNIGAAAVTYDVPAALRRVVANELGVGRIATVVITLISALAAQLSGTLVAFLGIFGWGLFTSTLVPALAIGLNWPQATRAGAIASIATGLAVTLVLESLAYFHRFTMPGGVSVSALSLVLSLLVFFVVSYSTSAQADAQLDADIRAVMEV